MKFYDVKQLEHNFLIQIDLQVWFFWHTLGTYLFVGFVHIGAKITWWDLEGTKCLQGEKSQYVVDSLECIIKNSIEQSV